MRKLTDATLRESLTVGHFGNDGGPLPVSDPLTPTAMVLPIVKIESYDRNPRRAPNGKYEELRESIQINGLRQPLVITRRPDSENYIPKHGGNTRLTILKELFAETGDQRFATANCLFEPWSSEADVLIGHLVENELRGELVFIDKARAIRDAKVLIEEESGAELSMRQLAEALRARGYRVTAPMISRCEYAVDILSDSIPRALAAGLGRPAIQRIRDLDRAATAIWQHRELGPNELYRSIFAEAIASVDHEVWDFDLGRRALADGLAVRAGAESRHLLLEIGAEMAGTTDDGEESASSPPSEPRIEHFEPRTSPVFQGSVTTEQDDDGASPLEVARSEVKTPAARTVPTPPARRLPSERESPGHPPHTTPTSPAPLKSSESAGARQGSETFQLQRLRMALGERAREYSTLSELGYCLRFEGSPWIRLGYIVADFPAQVQLSQLKNDFASREALAWKWYELTRCCDLLPIAGHIEQQYGRDPAVKERVFAELFGANPRYLKAWASPDAFLDAISDSVGIMDLQQFSFYAERVDDNTWHAGMRLLQAYRDLKAYASERRIDLMQDPLGDFGAEAGAAEL